MHFTSVSTATIKSSANIVHEVVVPQNASFTEMLALFDHFAQFCAFETGVPMVEIEDRIISTEGKFFFEMNSNLDNTNNSFFSKDEIMIG